MQIGCDNIWYCHLCQVALLSAAVIFIENDYQLLSAAMIWCNISNMIILQTLVFQLYSITSFVSIGNR